MPKPTNPGEEVGEETRMQAHRLRAAVDNARRFLAANPQAPQGQADLAAATTERQEFWLDTCREVREMHVSSPQVVGLYQRQGCRFFAPNHEQAQELLDALDSAMPLWDRDHPELFYQTLELNFPELVRHG